MEDNSEKHGDKTSQVRLKLQPFGVDTDEMRKQADGIAKEISCSPRLVYSEIQKTEKRKQLVEAISDLFIARTDTYGRQNEDGSYTRIEESLGPEVIMQHLDGETTVGAYQLSKENNVKTICFDVDPEVVEDPKGTAAKLVQKCKELFPPGSALLEASRLGDPSFHIWVFFKPEIPAFAARFLADRVIDKSGVSNVEVFPKQAEIKEGGFGNLIKLPLGLHRKDQKWSRFLDSNFDPLPAEALPEVTPTTLLDHDVSQIKQMLEERHGKEWFDYKEKIKTAYKGPDPPCITRLLEGAQEGNRNESAIRLVSYWLSFKKLEPQVVMTALRDWNAKNKPPLGETEINTVFQSALRGNYNYGCNDPILSKTCEKKLCSFSEKEPVQVRLADLSADLLDQPIKAKVQIIGESDKMAFPKVVKVVCSECGFEERISLEDRKNYQKLKNRLFGRRKKKNFESWLKNIYYGTCCPTPKLRILYEGNMDYCRLFVRDLIEEQEKWEQRTYRTHEVLLIGKSNVPAKKAELEGIVITNEQDKILILAYDLVPLEESMRKVESTEGFDKYFRKNHGLTEDLDQTIANHITGRSIAKEVAALVMHSPISFKFEGQRIWGNLWAMFVGDTTTGKSETGMWISKTLGSSFCIGEQTRRTGLLFTVDTENKVIYWGDLVQEDLGLCFIDSIQGMAEEEIASLREARRQGIVKVRMAVSGEALVRTRVLAAANPKRKKPMSNYMYLAQSLKDIKCIPDVIDLTRWDLFVPFKSEDVSNDEIAEAKVREPAIPLEVFRNHVYWAWSLRDKDIEFTKEAENEAREQFKKLKDVMWSPLPVINKGYKKTLARIAASYAVLMHNVKDGKVIIEKAHAEKAAALVNEMIEIFQLRAFVRSQKRLAELTDEEVQEFREILSGKLLLTMQTIAEQEGLQVKVLAEKTGITDRMMREYMTTLKSKNLVEEAEPRGYQLTTKGVQALKRLLSTGNEETEEPQKTLIGSVEDAILGHEEITSDEGVQIDKLIDDIEKETNAERKDIHKIIEKLESDGKLFRPKAMKVKKA
jgi:predicted transcriptional regulator